ncbi:MAG: winged helix-turn-helix transcriptional regulator [Clostridia bacterium]|nr:winged helix-turn-helix transcriptional regulator [Clostridia bacterium]
MPKNQLTLMRAVGRAHREWRRHMRKCALEVGIPESYRTVLMFLSRNPGANQRMIAEFSETTTAAVNQVVKKMIENGYVEKKICESDGRHTSLYLTEKGAEKAVRLRERLGQSDAEITEMLGEECEAEIVKTLMEASVFIGEM